MLEARGLCYRHDPRLPLIEDISLKIASGEILGLSGPSGCGKSTLARLLAGYLRPLAGQVLLDGAPAARGGPSPVQYLPQSPIQTMNPRWRIGRIIAEGAPPAPALAAKLGVEPGWTTRFPHELSGGQLMRVALLRAVAISPRFLIADEISAPLDAVAQAELWHVLLGLARETGIGILAISHDEALLSRIATRRIGFADRMAAIS
ncbi:ATP-binding cassette domain-containing protein [Paracoccus sp. MA]|uniref:ABC transporter ATP-binding protein n=1 Tax=Paracoccus sp. MA TaxID=2895796 RepID=UPI001E296ACF|nr:ATP-binding cassette domain-containing protein [Paracoccus sp. MA]UFM64469.1 ATP-binding cassette domain-containing protein [Paracoccus sp. MA]